MTMVFDFIPLALTPMSVLTAITLFFYAAGFGFFYSTVKREFRRINHELRRQEVEITEAYKDLNGMKTDIALLLQSVTRIEKLLEQESEIKGDTRQRR